MPTIKEVPEAENDILLKDLDIPTVRERSPDPHAGPRLNVTAFRVQGIVEFPELGITRQALIDLVEEIRMDFMQEDERIYDGYTLDELAELQGLITEIERNTRGEMVGPYEVQRLVFLIRDQQRRRGVTLGMLELVADQITNYYRRRGFVLAKAFIPEQQVRDGVVTITLLLGYLGEVQLVNNQRYSENTAKAIFSDVLHQPVTTQLIEEKIFFLNDLPGLQVQGFFAPGRQVGDTALTLNVVNEERYKVNMRTDNHGSDITGEYRAYGDLLINNPLKYGDQLHLAALWATIPETTTYGMVRYKGPLLHYRWGFEVSASQNAFVTGMERQAPILGRSETYGLGVRYQATRGRVHTSAWRGNLTQITSEQTSEIGGNSVRFNYDKLHNASIHYEFDVLNTQNRTAHIGNISLTHSMVAYTEYNHHLRDAWIMAVDYTSLRFVQLPLFSDKLRWISRYYLQYTGRELASANKLSLAGPTRARAFPTNTFFADDGIHMGNELFIRLPSLWRLNELFQPYILADAAYGVSHIGDLQSSGNAQSKAHLINLGLGSKISVANFRGNFSYAWPVSGRVMRDIELEVPNESKLYFDLQYTF